MHNGLSLVRELEEDGLGCRVLADAQREVPASLSPHAPAQAMSSS
jgi:hypothetical protein